jgi:hypothetical protein
MTAPPQWYPVAAVGTLVLTGAVVLGTREAKSMVVSDKDSATDRFLRSRYSSDKDGLVNIEKQPAPSPQQIDIPAPPSPSPGSRKYHSHGLDKGSEPKIAITKPESSQRPSPTPLSRPAPEPMNPTVSNYRESRLIGDDSGYQSPSQARHEVDLTRSPNRRRASPPLQTYSRSTATFLGRKSLPLGVNVGFLPPPPSVNARPK